MAASFFDTPPPPVDALPDASLEVFEEFLDGTRAREGWKGYLDELLGHEDDLFMY